MNMLYNGVELPEIPKRDEALSCSLIYSTAGNATIVALFTDSEVALRTLNPLNFDGTYRDNAVYELNDGGVWVLKRDEHGPVDGVGVGEILWANYNVFDPDGNIYLAASEPLTIFAITHTIHADLIQRGVRPKVDVVQGDALTRRLEFVLTAAGVPWEPPEDATAALSYIRPDGVGRVYDTMPNGTLAYTISENRIRFTLLPEVLMVAGEALVVLRIIRSADGAVISTFAVELLVAQEPSLIVNPNAEGINPDVPHEVHVTKEGNVVTVKALYLGQRTEITTMTLNDTGYPVSAHKDGLQTNFVWEGFIK